MRASRRTVSAQSGHTFVGLSADSLTEDSGGGGTEADVAAGLADRSTGGWGAGCSGGSGSGGTTVSFTSSPVGHFRSYSTPGSPNARPSFVYALSCQTASTRTLPLRDSWRPMPEHRQGSSVAAAPLAYSESGYATWSNGLGPRCRGIASRLYGRGPVGSGAEYQPDDLWKGWKGPVRPLRRSRLRSQPMASEPKRPTTDPARQSQSPMPTWATTYVRLDCPDARLHILHVDKADDPADDRHHRHDGPPRSGRVEGHECGRDRYPARDEDE